MKFNEFDVVRILRDFPEEGVKKGDDGAIIHISPHREAYLIDVDAKDGTGIPKAEIFILPEDLELVWKFEE